MPDTDGYPTMEELLVIERWRDYTDYRSLLDYIKEIWRYSDCGYWREKNGVYRISTGGWSGNEDIISAMMVNRMFWGVCWWSSRRGGRYVFKLPKSQVKEGDNV